MPTYPSTDAAITGLRDNVRKATGSGYRLTPLQGAGQIAQQQLTPTDLTTWQKAAMVSVASGRRGGAAGTTQVTPGTRTITLPEGQFDITEVKALMGLEGLTGQLSGLRIVGQGEEVTTIRFAPAAAGDMAWSRYWQNVTFEHLTFACTDTAAGSTFFHGNNTDDASAGQHFTFRNCTWQGKWRYLFHLEGVNNLSEFTWDTCSAFGLQDGGAWLRIPITGSDQMLNYHWAGVTRFWSHSALFIDADKGGHFTIEHLDVSDFCNGRTSGGVRHIFRLGGESHALGVCSLNVAHLRVEAKSSLAGLLRCEWASGNVSIRVDYSSQAFAYTYGEIVDLQLNNGNGPIITFHDSQLAGKVGITYGDAAWGRQHKVSFDRCFFIGSAVPTDVIAYHPTGGNTMLAPRVEFTGCSGDGGTSVFDGSSLAIWDATVGYARQSGSLKRRAVQVTAPWGGLGAGDVAKVQLPLGATIDGIRVEYGSNPNPVSGTVTLQTTETTAATIATVAATSAGGAAGFRGTSAQVPFRCDTAARATVQINGLAALPADTLIIIEGYW